MVNRIIFLCFQRVIHPSPIHSSYYSFLTNTHVFEIATSVATTETVCISMIAGKSNMIERTCWQGSIYVYATTVV